MDISIVIVMLFELIIELNLAKYLFVQMLL